jgi:hypothetical protein
MKNTSITLATKDFLIKYAPYCTHAITLQTNLATHNVSATTMLRLYERAQRTTRQFNSRLAYAAYANGAIRKPNQYHPLIITAIEGTLNTYDKNRTLHTHIALGNIINNQSRIKTEEQLAQTISDCWLETDCGANDIDIKKYSNNGWINYITKEFDKGNMECVDWTNTHIPFTALN